MLGHTFLHISKRTSLHVALLVDMPGCKCLSKGALCYASNYQSSVALPECSTATTSAQPNWKGRRQELGANWSLLQVNNYETKGSKLLQCNLIHRSKTERSKLLVSMVNWACQELGEIICLCKTQEPTSSAACLTNLANVNPHKQFCQTHYIWHGKENLLKLAT